MGVGLWAGGQGGVDGCGGWCRWRHPFPHLCKVQRDFRWRRDRPGLQYSEAEKGSVLAKLEAFFSESKQAEAQVKHYAKELKMERLSCALSIQSLDRALRGGVDLALGDFRAKAGVAPLDDDDRRYFVTPEEMPQAFQASQRKRRACIKNTASKKRRLELPAEALNSPALFLVPDQGSSFWPALFWMYGPLGIRVPPVLERHPPGHQGRRVVACLPRSFHRLWVQGRSLGWERLLLGAQRGRRRLRGRRRGGSGLDPPLLVRRVGE